MQVKPLEWQPHGGDGVMSIRADTIGLRYYVVYQGVDYDQWRAYTEGFQPASFGDFDTKDEAEAACQADFEARIRSTLSPPKTQPVGEDAVEALKEAEETLRLSEHPALRDPRYGDEIEALGRRIGFGALMSSASASWRAILLERGDPVGSEFVAGPCHATVIRTLKIVRAALKAASTPSEPVAWRDMLEALKGLVGLVQLVRSRPDCPVEIKQALTDHYRLDDAFAALAKATAPLGEEGWRSDMESAPKDGTPILLYSEKAGVDVGVWWERLSRSFTHWRPLPPAPSSHKGDA